MSESAPHAPFRKHVVLLGLMGVGKSTTGSALAERLGVPAVDSDVDIEKLLGCSGADFAARNGVSMLHELEAAVLLGALRGDEPSVISAASSTVENQLVRWVLPRRAVVVRLQLDHAEAIRRQATGDHRRPMTIEELEQLAERREPFFASLSDLDLDARHPTDALVATIARHLEASDRD